MEQLGVLELLEKWRKSGKLHRGVGRFYGLRRSYSRLQWSVQLATRRARRVPLLFATVFPDMNPDDCVRALRQDGVCVGLRLEPAIVEDIRRFAEDGECTRVEEHDRFRLADVRNARLPDGRPVPLADVFDADRHPAVARIARDPRLMAAVRGYLGYWPNRTDVRLYWSLVGDVADDVRRELAQTLDYHYDVSAYNFVYAYFYLTPTDEGSGPHVVVKGSHLRKPLRLVLASAFQPDEVVHQHFGEDSGTVVTGEAGFGFLEDSSCYHKVIPPTAAPRLMLQIRFS
jgi:hypothetical protein